MAKSASFGDTRDPLEKAFDRAQTEAIIRNSVRQGREIALEAVIKLCQGLADRDGSAADCLQGIRQLRDAMN